MSVVAWAAAAVFALINWYGCARGNARVAGAAKPLTLIALTAAACVMGAAGSAMGRWLLAALLLSLAGDVFLMGETPGRFLLGLASFLLGHAAYVVAFVLTGLDRPALGLAGVVAAAVVGAVAVRRIIPGAAAGGGPVLGAAVVAYVLVIAVMVITGWATGHLPAGLGGTLFMISDTVLAWNRFVRPLPHQAVIVMATYHVAQFLLVLGLLS